MSEDPAAQFHRKALVPEFAREAEALSNRIIAGLNGSVDGNTKKIVRELISEMFKISLAQRLKREELQVRIAQLEDINRQRGKPRRSVTADMVHADDA